MAAAAADALPEPRSEDGKLVLQCEEFESLAEPIFERLKQPCVQAMQDAKVKPGEQHPNLLSWRAAMGQRASMSR